MMKTIEMNNKLDYQDNLDFYENHFSKFEVKENKKLAMLDEQIKTARKIGMDQKKINKLINRKSSRLSRIQKEKNLVILKQILKDKDDRT